MSNQDLRQLSGRLAALMESTPQFRDPLDYLIGAIYALLKADELKYDDRNFALPDQYWQFPITRARQMEEGTMREDGKWLAGFYFNSALLRVAASFHRILKLSSGVDDAHVPELIRVLEKEGTFPHSKLDDVHREVNLIKHDRVGLEGGRGVSFEVAIGAVDELLDLVESHAKNFKS